MNIKLLSQEHAVEERNGKYYVYSPLYECPVGVIFMTALADVIYPLSETFRIPLCVEIEKGTEPVTVGEKLEIIGTDRYRYFVTKRQYENWRKTYYVLMKCVCVLILLINTFCIYLFLNKNFDIAMGMVEACVAVLSLLTFRKFKRDVKARLQHEKRDMRFSARR